MSGQANSGLRVHKPSPLSIGEANSMHSLQAYPSKYSANTAAGLTTPSTYSPVRHTSFIDLSDHGLAEVPSDVPADAYSLNMSSNMLTQMPPSFGRTFNALHILDISNNQIAALPEEISHLHNLRELYANHNALVSLPITMGSLRNLEILELSENYIITLDISISRLEKLRMLNISDNRLASLPPYLGLLAQNLRILLVDGNPFEKFQRDLIEPILTVPSKEAKKIAKAKEKAEKLRAKAAKNGGPQNMSVDNSTALHSQEYAAALKKLISVRLKRGRKSSPVSPQTDANARASVASYEPTLQRTNSQSHSVSYFNEGSLLNGTLGRSISLNSKQQQQQQMPFNDAASIGSHQSISPPLPGFAQPSSRDSAVIPTDVIINQMNALNVGENGSVPDAASPDSATKPSFVAWENIVAQPAELNEYMARELPPPPSPSSMASPTGVHPDSARSVALNIARRIATGVSGSNTLTEQELIAMTQSQQGRYSNSFNTATGLLDRSSIRSSVSQDSHGSSMDESVSLIQDAAKVARVLWQLCDEWDLNPRHSESDSVDHMLAQLRNGNVRMDGASGIDRVYREKAPTVGNSQRMKILSELLVTEVTYVDTLKNVVGVYLNPMREAKILSETELRDIFSNIEVILAFHNDHFLPAITYAISQQDMAIGEMFLHHGAHFRLYSMYTNNHETSVKTLTQVSSRRTVNNFIQGARYDVTQIGQVGLDGHLLTPVQRLPRYRMLLTDLLGNTPVDHPDHEPLYNALKELNKTIHEVNEKKRAFENQARLRKIQDRVAGSADIPLIVPYRTFKLMANFRLQIFSEPVIDRSGALTVRRIGVGTVYRYFLFNDMIMQCTIIMNKDLRVSRVYKLGTRVTPAEVTCDNELRIVDSEGVLYLKGDPTDLRKWAHEINNRLEG